MILLKILYIKLHKSFADDEQHLNLTQIQHVLISMDHYMLLWL